MWLFFASPLAEATDLRIEVFDPADASLLVFTVTAMPGAASMPFEFRVGEVRSWSPEAPNLYRVRIEMLRRGASLDAIEERFGFRTIETRDGKLYLNGEPLYLSAAPSTRTTIRTRSAPCRRWSSSKTSSARRRSSASTACAATSRRRTRATTRSPTGSAC